MTGVSSELAALMGSVREVAERNTGAAETLSSGNGAIGRAMDDVAGVSKENSASAKKWLPWRSSWVHRPRRSPLPERMREVAASLHDALRRFRLPDGEPPDASGSQDARRVRVPLVVSSGRQRAPAAS